MKKQIVNLSLPIPRTSENTNVVFPPSALPSSNAEKRKYLQVLVETCLDPSVDQVVLFIVFVLVVETNLLVPAQLVAAVERLAGRLAETGVVVHHHHTHAIAQAHGQGKDNHAHHGVGARVAQPDAGRGLGAVHASAAGESLCSDELLGHAGEDGASEHV